MVIKRLAYRGTWRPGRPLAPEVPAAAGIAVMVGTLVVALSACGPQQESPPSAAPGVDVSSAPAPAPESPATSPAAAAPVPASTTAPATPTDPTICRSNALSVTLGGSEGAAGTVYASLRFTNTGPTPCVIHGFPGVSYVGGDNGAQIGPAAERDGVKGAPVNLPRGAVASAQLAMVQVRNYDASVCHPTPVKGLRVYPPGETASVFVPLNGTGCSATPPGPQLRVKTVQPGPGQN
ncbi:MAG TPA: DUF4232 domain-containing protein [Pseudonocardia sp.]|nr:DUF4232 domain-containing protein [Pseudonocardia sp.]